MNSTNTSRLKLDLDAGAVYVDGIEVSLTRTELKLLAVLIDNAGRLQSRPALLQSVWEAAPDMKTRTVDMHVARLRNKLGPYANSVKSVRGMGYRFLSPNV
jgi:two-component system phosphate regulon response regulator PhoB